MLEEPENTEYSMIELSVAYNERDLVKRLGARWSAEKKTWYVPAGALLTPFERWLPSSQSADYLLSTGQPASKSRGTVSRKAASNK